MQIYSKGLAQHCLSGGLDNISHQINFFIVEVALFALVIE